MHPAPLHLGPVAIPPFGLLAALGVFAALRLSERTATLLGLDREAMWSASVFTVLAAFVSSRVLLLLSDLRGFLLAPVLLLTLPSLTVGGVGLTVVLSLAYLRWKGLPILRALDAWAAPGLLLWAALALGHLLERSDPGMPTAGWGLRSAMGGFREQPVALYAALLALGLAGVVLDRTQPSARLRTDEGQQAAPGPRARLGRLAAWALLGAGVAQFGLTFLRLPYLWGANGWWVMLDPLQWAALGMVVVGGALWLASERTVTRDRPGAPQAHQAEMLREEG